jgi:hypothetical protein
MRNLLPLFLIVLLFFSCCSNQEADEIWIRIKDYDQDEKYYLEDTIKFKGNKLYRIVNELGYDDVREVSRSEYIIEEAIVESSDKRKTLYFLKDQKDGKMRAFCAFRVSKDKALLTDYSFDYDFSFSKANKDSLVSHAFDTSSKFPLYKEGNIFRSYQDNKKMKLMSVIKGDSAFFSQFPDMYSNYLDTHKEEMRSLYLNGPAADGFIGEDVYFVNNFNPYLSSLVLREEAKKHIQGYGKKISELERRKYRILSRKLSSIKDTK